MRPPVVSLLSATYLLLGSVPAWGQTYPPPADLTRAITLLQKGMEIRATTVDSLGNVYVAGVSPLGFAGATANLGPRGGSDIFVIKLNPSADQVLYAASIGGTQEENVAAIRADAIGNLFVLGSTTSLNFPAATQFTPTAPFGGFLLKLNTAGNALIYSTVLGWRVAPLAMDIDSAGAAVISGLANSQDLPTSPGVIDPAPAENAGVNDYVGFVAKLNPAGSAFTLATYYGPKGQYVEAISIRPNGDIFGIHSGALVGFNSALSEALFVNPVNLSPVLMNFDQSGFIYLLGNSTLQAGGVVVKKLSQDGKTTLLNQMLPLIATSPTPRIAVTSFGRMFIFGKPTTLIGRPNPPAFPTLNATQTCLANLAPPNGVAGLPGGGTLTNPNGYPAADEQAMLVLEEDGSLLYSSFFAPRVPAVAVSPLNGGIYAPAMRTLYTAPATAWLGLIRFSLGLIPQNEVAPSCLVHSATLAAVPVSPGTLMSIFGSNLGPGTFLGDYTEGAFFALDQNGKVPFTLGGTTVTVDDKPAALLFTWNKQINFVVPWTTRTDGALVPVCVTRNSVTKCMQATTTAAVPANFDRGAVSAALNQDFTVHEVSNPAPRGSIVQLFMTGSGLLEGPMVDGGVTPNSPLQHTVATVTATANPTIPGGCNFFSCNITPGSGNVEVLFAGAAPALVMGVTQVNIRIPENMPVGSQTFAISFMVPGATSPVVAVVRLQIS